MADGVTVRTNLQNFKQQLSAFSRDFERKAIRAGVSAAAQVFKKLVVAKAPVLKKPRKGSIAGLLRRAIYVKRSRDSTGGREHYFVGVRQGKKAQRRKGGSLDAFYWRFLEQGHLARGRGQALRGGNRLKAINRARARASGAKFVPAYPFLAPAFREGHDRALKAFTDRIQKRIDQENRK